ncbi:MAG: right-handed parallel beta-helix repeat-containing protein [Candidatus Eisenbacteria bacterium]|nr:right-handed parallel beta-helix repeat-containing protein [Candidatus Eisenbacteria bacterium]
MKATHLVPMILLAAALAAHAGTITVPGDYTLLQEAVEAAVSGDTVLLSAGVYDSLFYPPVVDTTQCVVYMKSGVSLLGEPGAIIDGDSLGRGIFCDGVTGVRIEGLTVRKAFAEMYGSGIFADDGAEVIVEDCVITDNHDGGVIVMDGSDVDFFDCEINDNHSKQGGGVAVENTCDVGFYGCRVLRNEAPAGGGVFVRAGCTVAFENCVIDSNLLPTVNGAAGGVSINNSTATMKNSRVNANVSSGRGGGFAVTDNATVTIESTYVQNNETTGDYGPGGGIYLEMATLVMRASVVTGNSAPGDDSDGGGLFLFFANACSLLQCTIAGNGTVDDELGGGITSQYCSPVIEQTILAFNGPGAGITCTDGTPVFSCCDLYGNTGGDAICGMDDGGNFSQDPRFCDDANDLFTLHCDSPCFPGRHPDGSSCGLIGAETIGTCDGVGVDQGSAPEGIAPPLRHYASPNPNRNGTTIHFGVLRAGRVSVAIYDVAGRRVRMLEDRDLGAGAQQVEWDSRDDAGRPVSSGIYFYRITGDPSPRSGRLVITR